MAATRISALHACEILDSRGRPTVEVEVELADGSVGRGVSPSGASTGTSEACELRDGDADWFGGLGVRGAVANVMERIAPAILSMEALDQAGVDARMRELDGTDQLARLGGNAVLAVSLAVCRAAAAAQKQPLHMRLADLSGQSPSLPLPMTNILSGGLHAGRGMDVQDFLVIPTGATRYREALHWVARVRNKASELIAAEGLPTLLADEGGLAPGYADSREALALVMRAIEGAGLRPGEDVAIAIDVAATSLQDGDGYRLGRAGRLLDSEEMASLVSGWIRDFPIVSVEDALGEEDWCSWIALTRDQGHIQLLGDDLFTTNVERLRKGISVSAANAVLVKLNQNGTLSGTLEAMALAREASYATVVSARSGETEDDFMSHLAVGANGRQIKIGSIRNSERLAKYNTLLRLEDRYELPYAGVSGLKEPSRAAAAAV